MLKAISRSNCLPFTMQQTLSFPVVETSRLILRMFTPADLDDLARIFGNPAVTRYLGPTGAPVSREETEKALLSIINHWHRHGIGRWAVVHQEHRRLIGYGGLRWFEHEGEAGSPELVYLLDQAYWRQGLATEIAHASLKFGFYEKNFERVIAMTRLANMVSRHILEQKLRMRYLGEKKFFGIHVAQYTLTRAEYRPDGSRFILRAVA